jgi:hypothetical protein
LNISSDNKLQNHNKSLFNELESQVRKEALMVIVSYGKKKLKGRFFLKILIEKSKNNLSTVMQNES